MYKILVCGLTSNLGGIEKVILNFYQAMDKERFALDFICLGNEKIGFHQEFESSANRKINYIFLPKPSDNPFVFRKQLDIFFNEHADEYDAIWVNLCQLSNIEYLKLAKKHGIKKRIIHSHNGSDDFKGIKKILHEINRKLIENYATDFWACSDEASNWFYPPKARKNVKFIHNAIKVDEFKFDKSKRELLREELGINQDEIVIGHIGRISFQKNQEFILSVFTLLHERLANLRLVLIGGGADHELREFVEANGLRDKVIFLGLRNNIKDYYSLFDVFFFPSRYEGLPVTLLEAQANGLPILASDVISKQSKINKNLLFYSLDLPPENWSNKLEEIIKESKRIAPKIIFDNFRQKGFEISSEARVVEELFDK